MTVPITAGDRGSFEAEALPHLDTLYRFARRLTGDPTRAEDLVQETMLLAWRAWERFQAGNVLSWLDDPPTSFHHRVPPRPTDVWKCEKIPRGMSRTFREWGRKRIPRGSSSPGSSTEQVQSVIDALPPDYRTALVLSDVEGLIYADIAQVLGIPMRTVAMVRTALERQRCPEAVRQAILGMLGSEQAR